MEKYMLVIEGHAYLIKKAELISSALCRGFDDFETKREDGLYKCNENGYTYDLKTN